MQNLLLSCVWRAVGRTCRGWRGALQRLQLSLGRGIPTACPGRKVARSVLEDPGEHSTAILYLFLSPIRPLTL
eukprot:6452225-Pyramimonas_sp.AAC.1